jgi:hypothetical protein
MKSKFLLVCALALAAVLLLQQAAPWHESGPGSTRQAAQAPTPASAPGPRGAHAGAFATSDAEPLAGPASHFGRLQALHGVQRAHWMPSGSPAHPQQGPMPNVAASGVGDGAGGSQGSSLPGHVARPANAASDAPDWRDSARELLSQIGVLCPASGCDSLEDD